MKCDIKFDTLGRRNGGSGLFPQWLEKIAEQAESHKQKSQMQQCHLR
jgi:hypothetical protein